MGYNTVGQRPGKLKGVADVVVLGLLRQLQSGEIAVPDAPDGMLQISRFLFRKELDQLFEFRKNDETRKSSSSRRK